MHTETAALARYFLLATCAIQFAMVSFHAIAEEIDPSDPTKIYNYAGGGTRAFWFTLHSSNPKRWTANDRFNGADSSISRRPCAIVTRCDWTKRARCTNDISNNVTLSKAVWALRFTRADDVFATSEATLSMQADVAI